MLLNSRTTRMLLEASADAGVPLEKLLGPLGMNEADLIDPNVKVEWKAITLICDQLSILLDGDIERLREIGRRMARTPSYAPFRRLAGAIVSVRALYDVASRYAAPANFPHLRITSELNGDRLRIRGELSASYTPSTAFFHVSEGSMTQLPALLELPPAVIIESHVTPRSCDMVLELPRSRSVVQRLLRGTRAVLRARDAIAVLEEQHRELESNVHALQRARDELRVLLDRLPDLVLVHASETVVWANGAFLTALGYEVGDLVGTPLADVIAGRPGALFDESPQDASSFPRVPVLTEIALRTRTGSHVMVEAAPSQRVVFDGIPARLVVGRDVTERNRMHQSLILADRLASVGLLAAGVAHEVNNPLAYVLNNIEIAQKQVATFGPGAEDSKHALSLALEGVDRIRTIVRDLLLLSRGDEGLIQDVDVRACAESTLALAAHEIYRTARLVQDLGPAPIVHASQGRIAQVLLNLVSNGVEAMRGRPRDENELVVRIARAADGRLLMEVSDTGSGIAAADLPRVFEPFFTTKPAGQGTGLGLSIAQRLVIELGGEITVSSVLGRGTTFRVLLPPAVPAEPPNPEPVVAYHPIG